MIDMLKKKRMDEISNSQLNELQKQMQQQAELNEQLNQQLSMLEAMAKQFMSKEAISRYGNLKIAHLEIAVKAIAFIAQAVQLGHIKEKLSDEQFKQLLYQIQNGKI